MWKPEETGEGRKDWLFTVYPPNNFYNYWHYKNGFRAWGDINPGEKLAFFISLFAFGLTVFGLIIAVTA